MPLTVDGTNITENIDFPVCQFLSKFPHLIERSKNLRDGEVKTIGSKGLLYVLQRELGMTDQSDKIIDFIGSEDATTCHIVILTHVDSDRKLYSCLSHFDGCGTRKAIKDMLLLITSEAGNSKRGRIELHVAGGFNDGQGTSEELSRDIFNIFQQQAEIINLMTFCVSDMNNILKKGINYPVIYGLVINAKTGEISKAKFPDKGPCVPLRSARHFTGSKDVLNIYNKTNNMLIIGPFAYRPLQNMDIWLGLSDAQILQHLSTSPAQEPDGFVEGVKNALKQMKNHPKPLRTVFQEAKPLTFTKSPNGEWVSCNVTAS